MVSEGNLGENLILVNKYQDIDEGFWPELVCSGNFSRTKMYCIDFLQMQITF